MYESMGNINMDLLFSLFLWLGGFAAGAVAGYFIQGLMELPDLEQQFQIHGEREFGLHLQPSVRNVVTRDLPLRWALASNAAFSFSCALIMLFFPIQVGEWLGVQAPLILKIIGIGLVTFTAGLIYLATRQRSPTWQALLVSTADFAWVLGSIALLLVIPQEFSNLGKTLLAAVGGAVFTFAIWQIWAAGRAHKTGQDGEYRHCIVVETNASAEKMWQIVSNMGDIKHYMPLLKDSKILDGKEAGIGAVRTCESHSGKRWSEECTAFTPGHSLDVRFVTEAPNFPLPVKTMRGGWIVTPLDSGCQITVWWELMPANNKLASFLLPMFAFQMDRDFPKIIQRMASAALEETGKTQMRRSSEVGIRILPTVC